MITIEMALLQISVVSEWDYERSYQALINALPQNLPAWHTPFSWS
ncbi:hypothetical protein [Vibrio mediterranei]|nr:hypothetical protein [Vibrio mediterranei]